MSNLDNADSHVNELIRQESINSGKNIQLNRANSRDSNNFNYYSPTLDRNNQPQNAQNVTYNNETPQNNFQNAQNVQNVQYGYETTQQGFPAQQPQTYNSQQQIQSPIQQQQPPSVVTATAPPPAPVTVTGLLSPNYTTSQVHPHQQLPTSLTSSRLRTSQFGNLLGRYPTLDPRVYPVMGQTVTVAGTDKTKSRAIVSETKISPQEMKGTSKIQFIPYQKKVVDYREERRVQRIPRVRRVVDFREQVRTDVVPREVIKQDYYAIQYLKEYVAEYVPEKTVQMVQKAVPFKRIQYVPVTRQVYHGAPLGQLNANIQNLPLGSNYLVDHQNHHQHGNNIQNWQSFANVPSFYQNYSQQLYPNVQQLPQQQPHRNYSSFGGRPAHLVGGPHHHHLQHNNNNSQYQETTRTTQSIWNSRLGTIHDSYESYVPSFKY